MRSTPLRSSHAAVSPAAAGAGSPPSAASLQGLAALARSQDVLGGALVVAVVCVVAWAAGYSIVFRGVISFAGVAASSAFEVVTMAAACVGGVVVGWLLPVERRPSLRHAVVVAGFALAFSAARIVADFFVGRALGLTTSPLDKVMAALLPIYFLTTSTFAGLGVGLRAVVGERDRAAAAARMEAELARARRRVLHSRLHPEFLVACLDAVSRRIPADAGAADRLLVRLGELLRLSLQRTRADQVPLAAELEYVSAFLDVEAGRAGKAARFRPSVPADLLAAPVPPGSVSTFVEAALGAAGPGGRLAIALRAESGAGRLRLRVADDVPVPVARRDREGVRALARSLEESFGAGQSLRFADVPGGGAEGVLELPLRIPAEAEAP